MGRVGIPYHSLQGAETYGQQVQDAAGAGDDELARFFRNVKDEEATGPIGQRCRRRQLS
jgi:hypothetical protein